jgi:hypothetical protein
MSTGTSSTYKNSNNKHETEFDFGSVEALAISYTVTPALWDIEEKTTHFRASLARIMIGSGITMMSRSVNMFV